MKKFLIVMLALFIGTACFAYQPPITSFYVSGSDVVAITIDPQSGYLTMVVNNSYRYIFTTAGVDYAGFHWHCDQFGDLLFSPDCFRLTIYEYTSRQFFYFTLMN